MADRSQHLPDRLRCHFLRSHLGGVLVAVSAQGIVAVLLGDDPAGLTRDLIRRFPAVNILEADQRTRALARDVVACIDAPQQASCLPLDIRGTPFQQRVWQGLRTLEPGSTCSYTQLAQRLGMPRGARAVASACAANPISVLIPCHRVVGSDGSLRGYAWGLARKRALLDAERLAHAA